MGETMKHLSSEELIEHYYEEYANKADIADHLARCKACTAAYAMLCQNLQAIQAHPVPARSPEYSDHIWHAIRGRLPSYEKKRARWMDFLSWNHAGYALACALVVMMAFLMGRNWEQSHSHISVATNNGSAKERIVLFVIDDHLNRSERLLVELKHADAIDVRSSQSIQKEARELLAENQLYMQSTAQPDNPALAAVLDHLGRVLVEVANEPDGLTPQKIARLQKEMNTSGLLFQIRVLRTKVNGQANHYSGQTKGTTI